MNVPTLFVKGTLQPDGITLRLEQKLALPPGRVTIAVQSLRGATGSTLLETLDQIHAEQRQRGRIPMTEEEMAAEISGMRAEEDEEDAEFGEFYSLRGLGSSRRSI